MGTEAAAHRGARRSNKRDCWRRSPPPNSGSRCSRISSGDMCLLDAPKRSDSLIGLVGAPFIATPCRSGSPAAAAPSVRARVDVSTPALAALHARAERRHLGLGRIARHVDQCAVTAGIVEAGRDQVVHAQLAHVAERHRRAGGVLGVSPIFFFASCGVVRSSLFLCAALPAIFSAGPFFTFSLGFAFGAFAFLAIRISVTQTHRQPCGALGLQFDNPRRQAGKLSRSVIGSPDLRLIVQEDVQQRVTDFQFSVVFDIAQLSKFVHEMTHTRARVPQSAPAGSAAVSYLPSPLQ